MDQQPPWERQPLETSEDNSSAHGDSAALAAAVQSSPDVVGRLQRMSTAGLSGKEAGAAALIGLAGAFLSGQLTPADGAGGAAGGGASAASADAARTALEGGNAAQLPTLASPQNLEAARQAGLTHVGSAIGIDLKSAIAKASSMSLGDLAQGLSLDAPDALAGGATAALLSVAGQRFGWTDDPVRKHQAAFIAYSTQFLASLKFNPNPMVAGLALRHAFKLLKVERALMQALVEAWEAALAGGAKTREAYTAAVAASADADRWAAALAGDFGHSPAEDLF